jgi:hypothetical protein
LIHIDTGIFSLRFAKSSFPLFVIFCVSTVLHSQSLPERWQARVNATQAEQPHWMTPIATVTPRLEQEFRFDTVHQQSPTGNVTDVDGGKGLELIPARRIELLLNLPPYLLHQNPKSIDGWGDTSFTVKYRLIARNEEHGTAILTAFLGGSIPTGTYKNGSTSAIVTPTLAGGKGWGKFDVQSTLAGTLPVNNVNVLGRSIVSNTAFQMHVMKRLWPEVEINSATWFGSDKDGKKQTFVTPALILGRFPIHKRLAISAGAGFQMALTHFHGYDHAILVSIRMPF